MCCVKVFYFIFFIGLSIHSIYKVQQDDNEKKIIIYQGLTLLSLSLIALGIFLRFAAYKIAR